MKVRYKMKKGIKKKGIKKKCLNQLSNKITIIESNKCIFYEWIENKLKSSKMGFFLNESKLENGLIKGKRRKRVRRSVP